MRFMKILSQTADCEGKKPFMFSIFFFSVRIASNRKLLLLKCGWRSLLFFSNFMIFSSELCNPLGPAARWQWKISHWKTEKIQKKMKPARNAVAIRLVIVWRKSDGCRQWWRLYLFSTIFMKHRSLMRLKPTATHVDRSSINWYAQLAARFGCFRPRFNVLLFTERIK